MEIPFSSEEFLNVFKKYNTAVWPLQLFMILLAIIATYLLFNKKSASGRIITGILALLWAWMGVVYHLIYFTGINKAAYYFGGLFILQSILFLYISVFRNKITFRFQPDFYGIIASFFIFYSISIYPLISFLSGHMYPSAPTFGVPCPTTIFTFGILLSTDKKTPLFLFIIPFFWAIVGLLAAISLGMFEDILLFMAGVITLTRIAGKRIHRKEGTFNLRYYEKS